MKEEWTGSGSSTAGWLAAHDQDAPDELRAAVRDAVREHGGVRGTSSTGPRAGLVAVAIHCLGEALEIGSDRAAASPLLAADALLTYAVEAAAENGASLDDLSADVNGRLAGLLGE
jgi:hypothetical protein